MNFDFLKNSTGGKIQLGRGGPEKIVGELVNVHGDYMTIRTENSVVYCACSHIHSIVQPMVTEVRVMTQSTDAPATDAAPAVPAIPVLEADTFMEILSQMQNQLVQVNHGGPHAARGVLIGIGPDYITIVHEMKDVIHYPLYHVRSVSQIYHVIGQEDNKAGEGNDAGKRGEARNDSQNQDAKSADKQDSSAADKDKNGKDKNGKDKNDKSDKHDKSDKNDKSKDSKKEDKKSDSRESDEHHSDDKHGKKRDKK